MPRSRSVLSAHPRDLSIEARVKGLAVKIGVSDYSQRAKYVLHGRKTGEAGAIPLEWRLSVRLKAPAGM